MRNIRSKLIKTIVNFFKRDSASGLVLFSFAILAMLIANSELAPAYNDLLHQELTIGFNQFSLSMSILHWINDGLMALFFLSLGWKSSENWYLANLNHSKKPR